MAGRVPAIHVFLYGTKDVDARHPKAEATPFFERLWPGMTVERLVQANWKTL